jgi:hypothetical protein
LSTVVKQIEKKGWLQNRTLCLALGRGYRDTESFDDAIYFIVIRSPQNRLP